MLFNAVVYSYSVFKSQKIAVFPLWLLYSDVGAKAVYVLTSVLRRFMF